jgi:hypothetical protein
MSLVWDKMIPVSEIILDKFKQYNTLEISSEYKIESNFLWENYLFTSDKFRRAHIEILDARGLKKMWVFHMTVFPHFSDPSPIFGFDMICGASKITGAFHDFSKNGECELYDWYQYKMNNLNWSKPRELPEWAKQIFSPEMLAAGNINTEEEMDKLTNVVIDNLDHYLYNVGCSSNMENYLTQYNKYCKFQKMNPHALAMMINIGVDEQIFKKFRDDILFPELSC